MNVQNNLLNQKNDFLSSSVFCLFAPIAMVIISLLDLFKNNFRQ